MSEHVEAETYFCRAVFSVDDVAASLAYYRDQLGFRQDWDSGDETLVIAQVSREGLVIILDAHSVIPRAGRPTVLSLSLHEPLRLAALHAEFEERGAKIEAPPFEVEWQPGLYQMDVADLDGNLLLFWGEIAAEAPS